MPSFPYWSGDSWIYHLYLIIIYITSYHSPFSIMVRVKRIIFKYFNFFKIRLTSKRMKYFGSLFILVFVYCKVSPEGFLHVFKNRGCLSIPLFLNPHLLILSTKVRFLVHYTLFISLCNFLNTLPNC